MAKQAVPRMVASRKPAGTDSLGRGWRTEDSQKGGVQPQALVRDHRISGQSPQDLERRGCPLLPRLGF